MIAYKAFNKDLSCVSGKNRFQYKKGVLNRTEEANCRQNGFHCASNPLDCLTYYPDFANSLYCIVDTRGDIDEDGNDSKISCTELMIIQEMDLERFMFESLLYLCKYPKMPRNLYVQNNSGYAENDFVVVCGEDPVAAGKIGTILAMAREDIHSHAITQIAVYKVDGVKFLPEVYYTIDGERLVR